MESDLREDDLIQCAAESGYRVTPRQVKRWRMAGLIPRPRQVHVPGTRGSVSVYPAWTLPQLLALLRVQKEDRRLDEIGFWLWWEGQWVDPDALREILKRLIEEAASEQLSGIDSLDVAERATSSVIDSAARSPVFRALRRRVGRVNNDLYSALVALYLLVLGEEPIWESPDAGLEEEERDAQPEDLLNKLAGLDRATTDRPADVGPLLDSTPHLPALFQRLRSAGGLPIADLAKLPSRMSGSELKQAREDARAFAEDLPDFVLALERLFGKNTLGLGIFTLFRQKGTHALTWRVLLVPLLFVVRGIIPSGSVEEVTEAIRSTADEARRFMAASNEGSAGREKGNN